MFRLFRSNDTDAPTPEADALATIDAGLAAVQAACDRLTREKADNRVALAAAHEDRKRLVRLKEDGSDVAAQLEANRAHQRDLAEQFDDLAGAVESYATDILTLNEQRVVAV